VYLFECVLLAVFGMRSGPELWDEEDRHSLSLTRKGCVLKVTWS
jgi:hypothetical protein